MKKPALIAGFFICRPNSGEPSRACALKQDKGSTLRGVEHLLLITRDDRPEP